MELRQLRYFVTVAEELHFRRAAEKLFVSQPPLSQQIKALEEELGVQLFVRSTRKVELTAPGRAFLDRARHIIETVESAATIAQRASDGEYGRLGVGYIHSASYTILPGILKRCRAQFPGIELRLQELTVDGQLDALLDDRIDVALVRMPVSHPRITSTVVVRERMVVALPAGHALCARARVPIRKLARELLIGYPRGGSEGTLHAVASAMCSRAGFQPRFIHEARTLHTALGLVRAGEGIAIVPDSQSVLHLQGVEFRAIAGDPGYATLGVAQRTDRHTPLVESFLRIAQQTRVPS